MTTSLKLIHTTLPDDKTAAEIIRTLLGEGLVACGNIYPSVRSIYRWNGEVCDEQEVALLLKTTRTHAAKVMERLEDLHPYDVPAIELLETSGVNLPYLNWVHSETA